MVGGASGPEGEKTQKTVYIAFVKAKGQIRCKKIKPTNGKRYCRFTAFGLSETVQHKLQVMYASELWTEPVQCSVGNRFTEFRVLPAARFM